MTCNEHSESLQAHTGKNNRNEKNIHSCRARLNSRATCSHRCFQSSRKMVQESVSLFLSLSISLSLLSLCAFCCLMLGIFVCAGSAMIS
jgi:hypothetical protein